MNLQQNEIRNLVTTLYGIQKTRVATGNRVAASLRPEIMGDDEKAERVISALAKEYNRITDAYVDVFNSKGKIDKSIQHLGDSLLYIKSAMDYEQVNSYMYLLKAEERIGKVIDNAVTHHPLWDAFFSKVKGCGTMMAAVCLAYLDPHKARHASSFWRYAGLDVVVNPETMEGEGRSRKHRAEVSYIDKDGNSQTCMGLGYNPVLKTKLVGVLGSGFLRAGVRTVDKGLPTERKEISGHYAQVYYDYRHRLDNRPDCTELSDIVKHNRANRYAVKMFLRDLWVVWRELEGLPITEPYAVAKLGNKPHHAP